MLRFDEPGLMRAMVDYQMDDQREPLPPIRAMVARAEEAVERRFQEGEERVRQVHAAVLPILQQRAQEAVAALREIMQRISGDAPFRAAQGQLNNIEQAEEELKEMHERGIVALQRSHEQLQKEREQNQQLRGLLQQLQQTLKSNPGDQISGFLKELAKKSGEYAARR